MADEPLTESEQPTEPIAPAPQYATAAELAAERAATQAALAQLNETMASINAGLTQVARSRVPDAAPTGRITRAAYMEAMQTGNEAVVEAYEAQQKLDWVQEHVAPLRQTGLGALANLTKTQATAALPYYKRWQKEIDAFVSTMPPEAQMSPDVYAWAHNAIVGQHAAELLREEREAALRGPAEPDPMPATRGRGRVPEKDVVPMPEDLADGAGRALAGAGKDADTMARKMGYTDWKDYMAKTKDYQEA